MYDELIKRLRETSIDFGELDDVSVMLLEAADAIEDLMAVLTASNEVIAKSKPKWIPLTEQLPEVGKDVLCFCRANIYFVLGWDGFHWHEGVDRYYMSSFVTHWMPLPEPPKESEP